MTRAYYWPSHIHVDNIWACLLLTIQHTCRQHMSVPTTDHPRWPWWPPAPCPYHVTLEAKETDSCRSRSRGTSPRSWACRKDSMHAASSPICAHKNTHTHTHQTHTTLTMRKSSSQMCPRKVAYGHDFSKACWAPCVGLPIGRYDVLCRLPQLELVLKLDCLFLLFFLQELFKGRVIDCTVREILVSRSIAISTTEGLALSFMCCVWSMKSSKKYVHFAPQETWSWSTIVTKATDTMEYTPLINKLQQPSFLVH
jgi:hypothetical protein